MRQNFKGITLFYLTMLLVLLACPWNKAAAADSYKSLDLYYPTDIDDHWAYDTLDNFVNADLLNGYPLSTGEVSLKPNHPITRAEFVSILVQAAGLHSTAQGKTFNDVNAGKWYADAVRIASSLGVVGGISSTEFGPDLPITRGDIAVMVVRTFSSSIQFEGSAKTFKDVPNYYAASAIAKASQTGIVSGMTTTTFQPFSKATRAQSVVMLERALRLEQTQLPDTTELITLASNATEQEITAMSEHSYDQVSDIYATYYTGYQLSFNLTSLDDLTSALDEQTQLDIEWISKPVFSIVERSNQYAVLEANGGKIKTSINAGKDLNEETISLDGLYRLKKMDDNTWKIYAVLPYEG
ncbi:S-layer homology domain-containing protein [Paenibacillus taichungensis]|uniref:S-layer homology domain-containing protein n=1 Tax=Paenibacillus taichungensis TaxID=484184 RepID=UPI002DB6BA93|nr:S-layer homology domain-containing protein [Paenibacillus taichungensis]MEC0107808.1 S-layer homology domain-containing protein [Paenibacillus taichungensis]MEC0200648.1 S-layer homology domain-containing protein [Paenibacillus taichungensis]